MRNESHKHPSLSASPKVTFKAIRRLSDCFEIGRTLGTGEFAKVKLAKCLETNTIVALKIIKNTSMKTPKQLQQLQTETSILSTIQHPNIIRLMQVIECSADGQLALVLEYANGGELFDYVERRGRLDNQECKHIMKQIFDAVDFLHSHNIVHRDLKLENILCTLRGSVHLTDFGFASSIASSPTATISNNNNYYNATHTTHLLHTSCGSPCYAAPELVLHKEGYVAAPVDIWSCGVVMFALAFGYLPFESVLYNRHGDDCEDGDGNIRWTPKNVGILYKWIVENELVLPESAPSHALDKNTKGLDDDGRQLLTMLLQADWRQRISMREIKNHPWFKQS